MSLVLWRHLYNEILARLAVCESGIVVVVIQHGDEGRARGAARGGTSILNHHHQLVAGLLLSVQSGPCADLTWGTQGGGFYAEAPVQSTGITMRGLRASRLSSMTQGVIDIHSEQMNMCTHTNRGILEG